jgi:inosine-uridine nucleoside N-ribohydrolase
MHKALIVVMAAGLLDGVSLQAQKVKVIVDQDARGPATTDLQSILVFLQSDKVDVLGITTVSGDQWVREETQHALRLVEIANRTDVPVIQGAEYPLLNSKEESERWEQLYGMLEFKGCWTLKPYPMAGDAALFGRGYHPPDMIPPLPEGNPHTMPLQGTAAEFMVRMVHQFPGEVVVWAGGPLTNIALALRVDPSVALLAKELVLMGSGMYSNQGGLDDVDGRREFNWWFDPEAVRIVMHAPWKKITITPIDISVKANFNSQLRAEIARARSPVARYLANFAGGGYMWDEIAAAAVIDPSIIVRQKRLYVDVDIDHGPSYGSTLFWAEDAQLPSYEHLANVQFNLDVKKFYALFLSLMTRRTTKH